jgi:hypothetical protein
MCLHPETADSLSWPQSGRERLILNSPIGWVGTGAPDPEPAVIAELRARDEAVMMMGDNPALPRMPERPTLLDFFRCRFGDFTVQHLLSSARRALAEGHGETAIMACLLHDISNGCLVRPDHGYWSAQIVAPYVSEEVAWAVKYHQALRYFPDESVGYGYPENYDLFFGAEYRGELPEYIHRDAAVARNHPWYMTSRIVTEEGLGHDDSPAAHMWRTMIWPNNFL